MTSCEHCRYMITYTEQEEKERQEIKLSPYDYQIEQHFLSDKEINESIPDTIIHLSPPIIEEIISNCRLWEGEEK